jgi:hypothetical protein
MAKALVLKRKTNPERAADIAKLKAFLASKGYDADDSTIEAAYSAWSASLPHKPAWHPIGYMRDEKKLLEALLSQLETVDSPTEKLQ